MDGILFHGQFLNDEFCNFPDVIGYLSIDLFCCVGRESGAVIV
jgi:hypothetical protein